MARKKSGGDGGNAVLVIFLVLFILLSIGMGVAFWTGQESVTKANQERDEAVSKLKDEQSAREKADLKTKLYKTFLGTATEDEKTSIQNPGTHAEALKQEHAALMGAVSSGIRVSVGGVRTGPDGKVIEDSGTGLFDFKQEDLLSWPWPRTADGVLPKQPSPAPLIDRVVKLAAERERMFHETNMVKRNAATDASQYQAEKAKYEKYLTDAKATVDAQIKQLTDTIAAVEAAKDAAIKEFKDTGEDARKDIARIAREKDDLNTMLREEQDKLKNVSQQLDSMLARQNEIDQEKRGVFTVNVPHGEIVSRKPGSNMVEINIGTDAGLRPGQTFTVQPASAKLEGLSRQRKTSYDAEGRLVVSDELASKGAIEVVTVLGPRLATARITEEDNPIRDSILNGDLLYNPLFRKNAKDHVVLAGIFDINADGIDDITEVARNLAKRGAVVDGYYDLSTRKWETLEPGARTPGPGSSTVYVIRGWPFDSNVGDALTKEKAELNSAINDAVTEAKAKGAQEVKAVKFLSEIGYSFSPSISDETTSAAAVKYLRSSAPAPIDPR